MTKNEEDRDEEKGKGRQLYGRQEELSEECEKDNG